MNAMIAVPGYEVVSILHDEIMVKCDGVDDDKLLEDIGAAAASVLLTMRVEIKDPVLPDWFVPDPQSWW